MIKILFIYLSWYFCFMLSEEIYVICNTMGHKENIVCFFSFPLPFPHLDISVIYAGKVLMTYTHCMHWLADIVTEHIWETWHKVKCDKVGKNIKYMDQVKSFCPHAVLFSVPYTVLCMQFVWPVFYWGKKKSCCKGKCFLVPFSVAHYSGGWSKSSKVIHKHGEKERGIFAEWFGCLDKTKTPWHTV